MPANQERFRPGFVEDWILASTIEAVALVLLSPAWFIRGQNLIGYASLGGAILLMIASISWWTRKLYSYHLLVLLYTVSRIALLGAGVTFLLTQSPRMALVLVLMSYLAVMLFAKHQRGWGYVTIIALTILVIILIASRPPETLGDFVPTIYLFALYLLTGGAVQFYFGHSMEALSSHEVLSFFGYPEPPRSRHMMETAVGAVGRALNRSFQLLRIPRGTAAGREATAVSEAGLRQWAAFLATASGRRALMGAIAVMLLVSPFLVRVFEQKTDLSLLITLNVGLLFVVLALGLNIVVGFAGLLDLGYAAFFAIGAYTLGVFTWPNLKMEWSFWVVIWISALLSAIFGMIIGTPTLRLRGDYLAIVTLAFGEIVPRIIRELWDINIVFSTRFIMILLALLGALLAMVPLRTWLAVRRVDRDDAGAPSRMETLGVALAFILIFVGLWEFGKLGLSALGLLDHRWVLVEHFNLTNGPQGMNPVGRPLIFGHEVGIDPLVLPWFTISPPMQWSYLIMLIGGTVIFATHRLEHSRLGRAWMAIREDETAADAMGVDPIRTKLLAFALGASFSGFAGSIYGAMIQAIFPELFSFLVSVFLIIIVIVSGMGNIMGVVTGGLIIVVFDRVLLAQIVPQYIPGGAVLQRWRWVMYASGLIAMMVLRPEGLFPSRARQAELHGDEESGPEVVEPEEQLAEAI
jgi:branched-chain amino acid transport system permease protein